MAVVVYDMAGSIVENLRSLADQSSGLQGIPFVNELGKLADLVSSIRRVLVDAEKKQSPDNEVLDYWLTEVEDVLHDVDDLVGEFRFEVLGCGSTRRSTSGKKMIITEVRNFFSSCSNGLVFWPKMNHRIKKNMERLDSLEKAMISLDLEERPEETFGGLWKSTISSLPRKKFNIGRENEKGEILQLLLGSDDDIRESVPVVPIVGDGGVGKTMLAQLVYDDEMVRNHFQLRMWVHVSKYFQFDRIVIKKLIQSANDSTNHISSEHIRSLENDIERLMMYVDEEITTKRFLLVLDDMCMNEDCRREWEQFKRCCLIRGKGGSRVIVTTRDPMVAEMTGTMQPCELSCLNPGQSLYLFESFFPDRQFLNDVGISEIGKKMVEKCGGNPFVIQAISGMLLFRDPRTQWLRMEQDLSTKICPSEKDILSTTVELSFDDLPSNLKKCFAYCSLFPKDYEIDVQTLIQLWMSEGFIHVEDVGYECFMNLLWRSFFEESERDEEDKVTKCKMQNLMHDHAKFVFRNRFITFGSDYKGQIDAKRTRHVSFDLHFDSLWQIPNSLLKADEIRTLILPSQLRWDIGGTSDESVCGVMVLKFKCLRTLDLHNSGIKVVPDSIGELKLLRYLDLSQNTGIKALPKSITKLQYLQTLKLNYCGRLRNLPGDIEKLTNLRNLEIKSCYSLTHMPRGLGKLPHLQTLSVFVSTVSEHNSNKAGGLDELRTLNNLRGELKVKNLSPAEGTKAANLSEKQFLRSLMLIWDIDAQFDQVRYENSLEDLQPHSNLKELSLSAYGGSKFPTWLPSHTNLVKFFLWRCRECQNLPLLDHLPNLEVLVLEEMTNLKHISDEESSAPIFYPSLKELRLTNLPQLWGWWSYRVQDGVQKTVKFPRLSKLIIEDCPNLVRPMPLFPDLKELLVLKHTHRNPFEGTINIARTTTSSSSSSSSSSTTTRVPSPLSELRTLCIVNMYFGYDESKMWDSLPSLCSLRSLRSLTLDHLTGADYVLSKFQHVTSLQELHIWRCGSLTELPTCIRNLSLRKLSIKLCPNLTILPDRISLVTSIQNVEIEDCPQISNVENLFKSDRINKR